MSEEVMFKKVFNGAECDKANVCDYTSEACRKFVYSDRMVCDPTKRWMYCYGWKRKLGMVFDSELGVYILPKWRDELLRRAKQ